MQELWIIARKCIDGSLEYFSGFDCDLPVWEAPGKNATKYTTRLHAETQALLLAQEDEDVQREAVRV